MLGGVNIYDPYSGYGPYGRHNREYSRHELAVLLSYLGFEIEGMFTANVHENRAENFFPLDRFASLVKYRQEDLGQYIFCRVRIVGKDGGKRPAFFYRSYPENELDHGV